MRQIPIALTITLLALAGCDDGGQSEDIEPTRDEQSGGAEGEGAGAGEGAPDDPGSEAETAEAAGPVIETDSFRLAAEPAAEYTHGELAQFPITITGRGKWHLNLEFGTEVRLTAPDDVELAKSTIAQEEAAEFSEEKARFDVPFTPASAGEHRVEAEVEFAVCTPETCVPKTKTLAVLLPVK